MEPCAHPLKVALIDLGANPWIIKRDRRTFLTSERYSTGRSTNVETTHFCSVFHDGRRNLRGPSADNWSCHAGRCVPAQRPAFIERKCNCPGWLDRSRKPQRFHQGRWVAGQGADDIPALLLGGRDKRANGGEVRRAFGGTEDVEEFQAKVEHGPIAFGFIVLER